MRRNLFTKIDEINRIIFIFSNIDTFRTVFRSKNNGQTIVVRFYRHDDRLKFAVDTE